MKIEKGKMKEETKLKKIPAMNDSHLEFLKLCNFMFQVIQYSYYCMEAKKESARLDDDGYGFTEQDFFKK